MGVALMHSIKNKSTYTSLTIMGKWREDGTKWKEDRTWSRVL